VDVVRPAQREFEQACADGVVADAIDENEPAGIAIVLVHVESDRVVEREIAHADFVQGQRLGGDVLERIDVDLVLEIADLRIDGTRADLEEVRPTRQHRLVRHPDDRRLELVRDLGRRRRGRDHIAAGDVDLVDQGQGDRLAGDRLAEVAIRGDDARRALAARGLHANALAGVDRPARDRSGEAAKVVMRTIDPLHRHRNGAFCRRLRRRHGLEIAHQRGRVPGHARFGRRRCRPSERTPE
jgi:hypothetical protein